jgi:ribulose-5-phosphate 4-epimerase/fuculose-1-phosphate aldolase
MTKYRRYQEEVLAISQKLSANGYFGPASGTGGNVSVRVDGEQVIAMTPSGKVYSELTPTDICVVRFDGSMCEGEFSPSVETRMHLAVYLNRPDVNAVVHTHQPFASIFALINQPIPALFDEVVIKIGPVVEIIPYAVSGSTDLEENVASRLENRCNCYIIQNHGAISLGISLEAAYNNAGLLEKVAQEYYHALATGKEITTIPDPVIYLMFEILKSEQQNEISRKEGKR